MGTRGPHEWWTRGRGRRFGAQDQGKIGRRGGTDVQPSCGGVPVPQLSQLLNYLVEQRGSDLIVKVGSPPHLRRDGRLLPTRVPAMGPAEIEALVAELLPVDRAEELAEKGEADIAHSVSGVGRFRVN